MKTKIISLNERKNYPDNIKINEYIVYTFNPLHPAKWIDCRFFILKQAISYAKTIYEQQIKNTPKPYIIQYVIRLGDSPNSRSVELNTDKTNFINPIYYIKF